MCRRCPHAPAPAVGRGNAAENPPVGHRRHFILPAHRLDFAKQYENQKDNQDRPKAAGWEVAEAAAVAPRRKQSDEQDDENDKEKKTRGAVHKEAFHG